MIFIEELKKLNKNDIKKMSFLYWLKSLSLKLDLNNKAVQYELTELFNLYVRNRYALYTAIQQSNPFYKMEKHIKFSVYRELLFKEMILK